MDIKGISDLLNMPLRIVGGIAVASGIVLLIPESLAKMLFVLDFREKHGFIIGLAFIISSSILVVAALVYLFNTINEKIKDRRFIKARRKVMNEISPFQQAIVYMLASTANNVAFLPMRDGAVVELESYMMISKSASHQLIDMDNPTWSFFLQKWVKVELERDSKLQEEYLANYNHYKEAVTSYASRHLY